MKKDKWDILPKILVLLLVTILAYSFYDHRQILYRDIEFRDLLSEFDGLLDYGRESEALETLRPLLRVDLSSFQYLQILKRSYQLAVNGRGVSIFTDFARRGAERFFGREDLWFIYCRALIMKGNPERAVEISEEKLVSPRFLGMRAESLLSSGMEIDTYLEKQAGESSFSSGGLIKLLNSRDPRLFSAAGREWNSPELIADAALLYAEEGSIPEANRLLKNSTESRFPELSLQIAYDAADPQYGLVLIQEMMGEQAQEDPGLKLYQAEFAIALARQKEAMEIYRDLIQNTPEYSVLPYVNMAVLDNSSAEEYLKKGLEKFPESRVLLERLGELYYREGAFVSAKETFTRLLDVAEGHPEARIRLADLELGAGSQGSTARLWDSYHGEQGDSLALFLGWRLFGNRDQEGLRVLLTMQKQRNGPDQDLLEGLYFSLTGDFAGAAEKFEAAYQKNKHWEYLYDAGRLYLEAGEAERALNAFSRADEIFTLREDLSAQNRSMVWLGIGESHMAAGDRKNAANALSYALDLDPSNLRATLMINALGRME